MIEADEKLLARMASGDEAALLELYRRYAPTILALAKRMLPDGAEEAVTEIFLEAHQQSRGFGGGVSVKTWLVMLAHRQLLKRSHGASLLPPDVAAWNLPEPAPPLRRLYVEDAFLALPEEERELLEAAYFQGRSFASLAAQLGTNPEVMAARLTGSLESLRQALEDSGDR